MTRISAILAAALACLPALNGCITDRVAGGTGAGNPPLADVALSFKASSAPAPAIAKVASLSSPSLRNPDGSFAVADSVGTRLLLTGIAVRVQRIDFDLPEGSNCDQVRDLPCSGNEASVNGPYSMDLISGNSVPAINFIKLPEGLYKTIGLEFEGHASGRDSTDDSTANIFIRGELAGPEGKRKFGFDLDLRDGLDFRDSAGIPIKATAINRVVLSLSVDGWFAGTDLRKCLDQLQPGPVSDTAVVTFFHGDSACGNTGRRIRMNIESSSDVEREEESEGR